MGTNDWFIAIKDNIKAAYHHPADLIIGRVHHVNASGVKHKLVNPKIGTTAPLDMVRDNYPYGRKQKN